MLLTFFFFFFFFLMIRLPPISTLFPYTTLFRSGQAGGVAQAQGRVAASGGRGRGRQSARQDRKSTRLNSSHLGNSYAVLCLKKKSEADVLGGERTHDHLAPLGEAREARGLIGHGAGGGEGPALGTGAAQLGGAHQRL